MGKYLNNQGITTTYDKLLTSAAGTIVGFPSRSSQYCIKNIYSRKGKNTAISSLSICPRIHVKTKPDLCTAETAPAPLAEVVQPQEGQGQGRRLIRQHSDLGDHRCRGRQCRDR